MKPRTGVLMPAEDINRTEAVVQRDEGLPKNSVSPPSSVPSPAGPRVIRCRVAARPTSTTVGVGEPLFYSHEANAWLPANPRTSRARLDRPLDYVTDVPLICPNPTLRIKRDMIVTAMQMPGVGYVVLDHDELAFMQPGYRDGSWRIAEVVLNNPHVGFDYSPAFGLSHLSTGMIGVLGPGPIDTSISTNTWAIYPFIRKFPLWVRYDRTEENPPELGEIWSPGPEGVLVRERLYTYGEFVSALDPHGLYSLTGVPFTDHFDPPPPAVHCFVQVGMWSIHRYGATDTTAAARSAFHAVTGVDVLYRVVNEDGSAVVDPDEPYSPYGNPYLSEGSMTANLNVARAYSQYGFKILGVNREKGLAFVTIQNNPMYEVCVAREGSRFDFTGLGNDLLGLKSKDYDGDPDDVFVENLAE